MEFSDSERDAVLRLMRWRRDVRHFDGRAIEPALQQQLYQAMELAPSVGNSRPWRVFQVESASRRQAVHGIFRRANAAALADQAQERQSQYLQLTLEGIATAPLQLAVFTDTQPQQGHGLGCHSMPETLAQSTAMAVHNLNLLARAHGLGVGMVSILDAQAMQQLFEVPPHWRLSLYLCIGWPKFHDDMPLLHRQQWQDNTHRPWQLC